MHSLLIRQLKKLNLLNRDDLHDDFETFLERVNQAYQNADDDRKLLENSLRVSSEEMKSLNSELKAKSETELAKSEARYRNLVTKLEHHYFFYSIDNQGCYSSVSRSVKEFLGYETDEFLTHHNVFRTESSINKEASEKTLLGLKGKVQPPYFASFYHKDGSERVLELTEAPVIKDRRVIGLDGIARNVTKEFQNHKTLEFLAQVDPLTNTLNRRAFEKQVHELIIHAGRYSEEFAMLFIDLDNFKHINDTLGHDVGDELLAEVAKRIQPTIRSGDVFGRFGGDEFVLVVNNVSESTLSIILNEVMSLLRETWIINDYKLNVSASIGVALYPKDGDSVTELMKKADTSLYKAKELGKDNFCFYTTHLDKHIHEEMELSQEIEAAIKADDFELYFQPKVQIKNNNIIGAEALIRWRHPNKGTIDPDSFINLAENTGYIFELGRWVVDEACFALARFNELTEVNLNLSINISVRQLQFEGLYEVIDNAIKKSGINPKQLHLEITETIMLNSQNKAIQRLERIKSLGIEIDMDDFGTGYSSLSYLNKLPIDGIKIDRSFVDKVDKDPTKAAVVSAIIGVGKALSLRVIAEGVETEMQRQAMIKEGCLLYQGFLFSEPLSESRFIKLIK